MLDGPAGSVSLPLAPAGTNVACLSAAGNSTANPLASCSTSTDAQGSGKLRFTSATQSQEGGVFASTSLPTSQGTWNPIINVKIPMSATAGTDTGVITESVS